MKLKNGAGVVAMNQTAEKDGYVVLATRHNAYQTVEWVTWLTDNDQNCFWGRYFDNYKDAAQSYRERINKYC